jgi:hypothetical protein
MVSSPGVNRDETLTVDWFLIVLPNFPALHIICDVPERLQMLSGKPSQFVPNPGRFRNLTAKS